MRHALAHLLGLGDLVDDLEAAEESRDDALVALRRAELEVAGLRAEVARVTHRDELLLAELHSTAAALVTAEARIAELLLDRI